MGVEEERNALPRQRLASSAAAAGPASGDASRPALTLRSQEALGLLATLALTLPALWPLLTSGFFVSDDGRFHLYRIAALAQAWAQGVLHPRLFPEFGFGYGQAVLNFYAPLSYWPGALAASAGTGVVAAVKLTIALGFILAALAAYGYARYLWGPAGGVLAAVAYTYFPYHLADAYLRGAVPEHFAFIWPPLILWAYTVAFRANKPSPPLLWGALAWAGLVYTHNLTALLMAPAWVLYLLVMAGWTGHWRRLLGAAGSFALGLALSAPLWLPFLGESGSVGIGLGPSDGYQTHLAPLAQALQLLPLYRYRLQQGGAADHPLSWATAALFVVALGLWTWRLARRQPVRAAPVVAFSLVLVAGAAFMITAPSLAVWRPLAPILANLQYPWRFLGLAGVGVMGLAGALPDLLRPAAAGRLSSRSTLVAATTLGIACLVLIVQPLPLVPSQPLTLPDTEAWAADRMWREDAEAGQVGATWTAEFLPRTVTEQRWALGRPREGATDGSAPSPLPSAALGRLGYAQAALKVVTAAPSSVRLHQFYLPGWNATVDGKPAAAYPSGEMGLVTVDVPTGGHEVQLKFGPTPWRTAGAAIAALAAVAWALLAWRSRHLSGGRGMAPAAATLLVLALVLVLNAAGTGQRSWTPRQSGANVEDVAILLGYDTAPARSASAVDVTLYWLALRDLGTDYKTFVHLTDGAGKVVAQHDGDPGGGYTPTTRWRTGELIADRHRLPLPAGAGGEYQLKAGMYQYQPPRNLAASPPSADGRIDLGTIRLAGS